MKKYTEEEISLIVEQCKSGSRSAKEKLYGIFKRPVFLICYKYTKDRMEAEDIAQECFIKIFNKIDDYRGDGAFGGWVRRIAVNLSITEYKKRSKNRSHKDVSDVHYISDGSYEKIESSFLEPEIKRAIDNLPPGYRNIFKLYSIDGYRHKEISDMLGIDINTSKSQLCRAKQMLAKNLNIGDFV
jgi:RNA polymerase sigma-70 factor (ECF subfamily)